MDENKLRNLFRDNPVLILLIAILALGIFVRVYDYNLVGMWNDDMSTIPSGLLWFYHHTYYPGLAGQGEPALGNLLVGAGCMLSGQDFSNVEKIVPMYYPGREVLLGKQITESIGYCRAPGVLFGIILLFLIAILSIIILDKYAALFITAFYAFYPPLIQLSTFIHVDVFGYAFVAASLISLYLFYEAQPGSGKEKILFALAILFASMAFSTKLPNAAYVLFAFLLLAEKNLETIKLWLGRKLDLSFVKKEGELKPKPLLENLILGLAVSATTIFIAFEFSFRNVLEVITKYRADSSADLATFGFNTGFIQSIYKFFLAANPLDVIVFLLSIYLLVKMALNFKELRKNEKFMIYLYAMFLAAGLLVETYKIIRVMIAFSFPMIMMMGMSLSSRYSPLQKSWKRTAVLAFIFVYLVVGACITVSISPHFISCNPLLKPLTPDGCANSYVPFATKQIGEKLNSIMADDETFVNLEGILFYYVRPEQGIQHIQLRESLRQQIGRMPTVEEKIKYFSYPGRTIRYVIADPNAKQDESMLSQLLSAYEPKDIAYLKANHAAYIYDLKDLRTKIKKV